VAAPQRSFASTRVFRRIIVACGGTRPVQLAPIEREHFGAGHDHRLMFRFVTGLISQGREEEFCCSGAFPFFPASCVALLPVAAAHRWHLAAVDTVWRWGAIGLGSVLAVVVAAAVRQRLSDTSAGGVAAAYALRAGGRGLAAICWRRPLSWCCGLRG